MIHIAVRVRELVSSNVDAMLDKADNPEKMLRHLRAQVEESLISLTGDVSRARRRHERLAAEAARVATQAEEWTAKAKTAVEHKREDLARAALLARENDRDRAAQLADEAAAAKAEADEVEQAVALLERKREEVLQRLASLPRAAGAGGASAMADSKAERHIDRIDELERRIAFGMDGAPAPDPAAVEAEIAALQREAQIDAELAGMKTPKASKPSRAKAK